MRLLTWERYVPDVEDNRARAARDEPAITVSLRPPTARVWRAFWLAITQSTKLGGVLPPHLEALAQAQVIDRAEGDAVPDIERLAAIRRGLTVMLSTLDDGLAAILWAGCVGPVEWPAAMWPDPTAAPPTTAAQVWALRDTLDSFGIYQDILDAAIDRSRLEAGVASFLASGPGRAPSSAAGPVGTAANVAGSG